MLLDKKTIWEILRFGIVGAAATVVDWGLFWILDNCTPLDQLIPNYNWYLVLINTVCFTVSVIFNYVLSRLWVFHVKKSENPVKEFVLFLITSVIGLGLNSLILLICVQGLFQWIGLIAALPEGIRNLLGKVIATFIVMIWNYISRKLWVFKEPKNNGNTP